MEGNGFCVGAMDVGILPPRKRLLAEMKRQGRGCEGRQSSASVSVVNLMCPSKFIEEYASEKFGIDLKDSSITLDQIVQAAKSAARAAAQVAASAKATAMEKAGVATKAAAAAKKALELVASFDEEHDQHDLLVVNMMEKQVPVKVLYKRQKQFHEYDEKVARKLHHTINSSPRIAKSSDKSNQNSSRLKKLMFTAYVPSEGVVCEGESSSSCINNTEGECLQSIAVCDVDKLDDDPPFVPKVLQIQNGKKHATDKQHLMYEGGRVSNGKKIKFKQKKLLLSIYNNKNSEKVRTQLKSRGSSDVEMGGKENDSFVLDANLPVESLQKRSSAEYVVPNCFVEGKIMEPLGPNSAVTAASSMIKVDQ